MNNNTLTPGDLKKIDLFKELDADVLEKICSIISVEKFSDFQEIFAEGSIGDSLYIVVSGEVVIRKRLKSQSDTYKDLAYVGPGDFFGELSIIDNLQRSAQALARGDTLLYKIGKAEFHDLMVSSPKSAVEQLLGFLRTMGNRIRISNGHLIAIYEIGMLITKEKNIDLVLLKMLEQIMSVVEAEVSGAAAVWNRFNRDYEIKCKIGQLPEQFLNLKWFENNKIKDKITSSGEIFSVSNFAEKDLTELNLSGSAMISPFFDKAGLLIGFFILHSHAKSAFSLNHKIVIAAVSSLASLGIINAWHQEEEDSLKLLNKNKRYGAW